MLTDNIREIGRGLCVGDRNRTICPYCNGGVGKEKSFSVERIGTGLLFNCFRASCGKHGYAPADGLYQQVTEKRHEKAKEYQGDLERLPTRIIKILMGKYGLTYGEMRAASWRWVPDQHRLWMPVLTFNGWERGAVAKALGDQNPKVLTYKYSDGPNISWHWSGTSTTPIVLVEDIISAVKVSRHATAVALLGVHLNMEMVSELGRFTSDIILALDPDAKKVALKLTEKYTNSFRNFRTALLSNKDPKDMTDAQIIKEIIDV